MRQRLLVTLKILVTPAALMVHLVMSTVVLANEFPTIMAEVDHIAETEGEFSMNLFEPLMRLADEQLRQGYMAEAEDTLQRAQHVAHRNEGVYTPRQYPIIDQLAAIRMDEDKPVSANQLHKFKFHLATRHYEGIDALDAHHQLTDWYLVTGQYVRARTLMKKAIDLIEEEAGENDLRKVEALRKESMARRLEGICCADRPIRKAIELLEESGVDNPDLERELFRGLGDALIVRSRGKEAAEIYAKAAGMGVTSTEPELLAMGKALADGENPRKLMYKVRNDVSGTRVDRMTRAEELAAGNEEPQRFTVPGEYANSFGILLRDAHARVATDEHSDDIIGTPFQFYLDQVRTIVPLRLEDPADMARIAITFEFTVTEQGKVRDLVIAESNAPKRLNRMMREVMQRARFRPVIVDGEPVRTENHVLTQYFRQAPQSG